MRFSAVLLIACACSLYAAKPMEIYSIDVEGGQSTLVVSPSGQSLLIDTGYAGNSGRDADRIAEAAKRAGVKRIDVLLITHHHADHVGGVANLLQRLPVSLFLDHGPSVELNEQYDERYSAAFSKGEHRAIAPGDKIPIKGIDATVVIAGRKHIDGKGEPNPYCTGLSPVSGEEGENPQSAGVVIEYGKFRFADLGDIIWNEELDLLCPENHVGKVEVYMTDHHATHVPPKAIYGLAPRVILMDNGPRKGGDPQAWNVYANSPGLEQMWQVHFSMAGGKEHNVPDPFIANLNEGQHTGEYLRVSANADGSFTVYNSRNKYTKSYPAK